MNVIKLGRKPILDLDAGHGGSDRFNKGTKWIEADGVLSICKRVAGYLPLNEFDINFTRTVDKTLSLTERAKMAAAVHADLVISHHTNAGGGKGGTDVFYSVDLPKDKEYAVALSSSISGALGIINRGAHVRESIKYPGEDYYTMIDATQDLGIDHVFLIEYAFHDNAGDEAKLLNEVLLNKACREEARIICEMFGVEFEPKKANPIPEGEIYRVRKDWEDIASQIGAFTDIELAKISAITHAGFNVYKSNGTKIFPEATKPVPKPIPKPTPKPKPVVDTKIVYLQNNLIKLKMTGIGGRVLEADGSLGPNTKTAISKFQYIMKYTVDGVAGNVTLSAISLILSKPTLKIGSTGIAVRYLQSRLGTAVDGEFGVSTKAAVRRLQGSGSDGVVGPNTWKQLIG